MERFSCFLSIFSAILFHCILVSGHKAIASIDLNDLNEFRAKNRVVVVDELRDLNQNSTDVIAVYDKMKQLEQKGFELVVTVPDSGATCSVKVRYHIATIIERSKQECDDCVVANLEKEHQTELNADQKNCINDIFIRAIEALEAMKPDVDNCKLIA